MPKADDFKHLETRSVTLKDLSKHFPSRDAKEGLVKAVDKINLEVKKGELVTLLGPSGCGKTTTLRMIAGFEEPTSGEIYIGDVMVNKMPPNRRETCMVFQSYALFPHYNVFDNIAYGLRIRNYPRAEINKTVNEILELIGLAGLGDRNPNQLSGGQQQRVALARALVNKPKVLLFDEPLSNLDAKMRVQMRQEIKRLQKELMITSIYVTHDQEEALTISDRVVIMNQGRIEQIGNPKDIYLKPQSIFVADFIGKANFIDCTVRSMDDGRATIDLMEKTISLSSFHPSLKPGDKAVLVTRPESIEIADPSEKKAIKGKIAYVSYLGAIVSYYIDFQDKTIISEQMGVKHGLLQIGSEVGIILKDNMGHLLPFKYIDLL